MNETYRNRIEDLIRKPGGLHEWCMTCRAPRFKRWNVPMAEIHRFRTGTLELKWTIPKGRANAGTQAGHHPSGPQTGSKTFHNELEHIIDTSADLTEFNKRVQELAKVWKIEPGLPDLIPVR